MDILEMIEIIQSNNTKHKNSLNMKKSNVRILQFK